MSYLTPEEIEIVRECRAHMYCTSCAYPPVACEKFQNDHGMNPYEECVRTCPLCGRMYTDRPAISRRPGVGYICPDCGTREAIEDWENVNC